MTIELSLRHDQPGSFSAHAGDLELFRYTYQATDPIREAPRPFLHPVRTLDGDIITVYRPHDHVWHKGFALSLPHVGDTNFWGGPTFTGQGYEQLPNNGAQRHVAVTREVSEGPVLRFDHELEWFTQDEDLVITESRQLSAQLTDDQAAWTFSFDTTITNVTDEVLSIGSPTTHGRDNAGYGGFFWRGPREFTGGALCNPSGLGKDELMGQRAPWMAFSGKHDENDHASTVVMVDHPDNFEGDCQWFARTTSFAGLCPAPFFSEEYRLESGASLRLRYGVVIATGQSDLARASELTSLATFG